MTDKAELLIDELIAACIAFGREREPDWQTRIEKARRELAEYLEELEGWLPAPDPHEEREKNG
jgi:hypothetical protein